MHSTSPMKEKCHSPLKTTKATPTKANIVPNKKSLVIGLRYSIKPRNTVKRGLIATSKEALEALV